MAQKYDPEYSSRVFKKVESKGGHNILFKDFQVYGSENLVKSDLSRTRLGIGNHQSHTDYMLLWLQYQRQEGAKMPMIASGKNLDLKALRNREVNFGKLGAFWVDRDKLVNSDRAEVKRVGGIIGQLVNEGQDIFYFPEGGRSYSGNLFEKYKVGVAKRFLVAAPRAEIQPIAFAYDKRIEGGFFNALKVAKKTPLIGKKLYVGLDALAFAKAYLIKGNRTAYMNVGKPTPLENIVDPNASTRDKIQAVKEFSIEKITRLYNELQEKM